MPSQPKEAPAEVRQSAAAIRMMFLALVEEGFTESQALTIVSQVVVATIENQ